MAARGGPSGWASPKGKDFPLSYQVSTCFASVPCGTYRARVRQLEAEDVDNTARLAAVEARAVSEMRAEQESCLRNISDAETRHQASPGLDVVVQLSIQLVHLHSPIRFHPLRK